MASRNFTLPTPPALDINDAALGELWKKWKHSWTMYALAAKLKDEDEDVQVAHLLTLIGRDANDVYLTFTWATVDDAKKIALVLEKFDQYCSPRVNVPFERYKFRMRTQESGETFDRYVTALRQMASRCAFPAAAADDFLRDQIIFGITDARVRERLLRELDLKLDKTMDTCRAAETSQAQMKVVENTGKTPQVNKLEKKRQVVRAPLTRYSSASSVAMSIRSAETSAQRMAKNVTSATARTTSRRSARASERSLSGP
ncbi:MAG: hypothetical protein FD120_2790 [Gammaproteobacteria bacterium]|nr:MAG: hypothetical protein FD120_2790 [Gammaproteobacteria bacterium]